MEFYLPNITLYASILIASSLILFFIGRAIIFLLPEWRDSNNAYQTVFNSYLLGYTAILPLFTIIWNRANSMFWLIVLLWLLYIVWWRKPQRANLTIDWRSEGRALLISVLLLFGGFALLYYFCFVRSEGQIFTDQIYYSNLSQTVLSYHNEAYSRTGESIAQIYHWGDSLTTALWAFVFKAKPLYVLLCVTYPFLLAMCILGVMTIVKRFDNSLPIILSLLAGILYFFQWNLTSLVTPWGCGGNISGLKEYLMIVFVVWGASYIIQGKYAQGFFAALMLVAYYTPLAPGILTLVCLLSYFMPDRPKLSFRELFNPYAMGAILITLFFCAFYALQPELFTEGAFNQHAEHTYKWILGFIIKRVCRPIAYITPVALVLGLYLYNADKVHLRKYIMLYICVVSSCFVSCIVAGAATKVEIDAGQIASNFYDTISHLFVYTSLTFLLLEVARKYRKIVYAIVVVATVAYPVHFFGTGAKSAMFPINPMTQSEEEAYLSMQQIFEFRPAKEIGYFRNYTLPENHNTAKTAFDLFFPMDRLVHVLPIYHPYCLSAYDMPEDMDPKWVDIMETELWQYGYKQKQHNPVISEEEIISEFITQVGINYIIVEKGARLPNFLSSRFLPVYEWDTNILYYGQ